VKKKKIDTGRKGGKRGRMSNSSRCREKGKTYETQKKMWGQMGTRKRALLHEGGKTTRSAKKTRETDRGIAYMPGRGFTRVISPG